MKIEYCRQGLRQAKARALDIYISLPQKRISIFMPKDWWLKAEKNINLNIHNYWAVEKRSRSITQKFGPYLDYQNIRQNA